MPTERYVSPLRYPGGKSRMAGFLGELFASQWSPMDLEVWIEPFAGGAGAGLSLLLNEEVAEVWLVEQNPALAAFWRTVVSDGDRLAEQVEATVPTLAVWQEAQQVIAAAGGGEHVADLPLAYAAFVTNRCSRSGIVAPNVGPLGGKHQTGRWKVDARFNGPELARRIRTLSGHQIRVIEGDGIGYIAGLDGSVGIEDEVMLFVDPPYVAEGNRLYACGMSTAQHRRLARALHRCAARWLLTYDVHPLVDRLYRTQRIVTYQIPHSANSRRVAFEYSVFSDQLDIPEQPQLLPTGVSRWLAAHPGNRDYFEPELPLNA